MDVDMDGAKGGDGGTGKNVQPKDTDHIRAFAVGVIRDYASGSCLSRHTKRHSTLTRTLARFMIQVEPSFTFTTIQVNKLYASKCHVDSNNQGHEIPNGSSPDD